MSENGNGHEKTKEQMAAEFEERKKRCEVNLGEFMKWLGALEECQMEVLKNMTGEVAAYFMSRSSCNILVLSSPEILLDIVSLMIYGFWQGQKIREENTDVKT